MFTILTIFTQERCQLMAQEIGLYKKEIKDIAYTIRQKIEQRTILTKKYESMPKTINRNMYTIRIMDIIKQVHKQRAEIKKVYKCKYISSTIY